MTRQYITRERTLSATDEHAAALAREAHDLDALRAADALAAEAMREAERYKRCAEAYETYIVALAEEAKEVGIFHPGGAFDQLQEIAALIRNTTHAPGVGALAEAVASVALDHDSGRQTLYDPLAPCAKCGQPLSHHDPSCFYEQAYPTHLVREKPKRK